MCEQSEINDLKKQLEESLVRELQLEDKSGMGRTRS